MAAVEKQARIMMTEDVAEGMLAASDQCYNEIGILDLIFVYKN